MAETRKCARTSGQSTSGQSTSGQRPRWQWLRLLMVAAGVCVALAGCDGGRPRANAPTPPVVEQPTPCPDSIACRALKRLDEGRQQAEQDR